MNFKELEELVQNLKEYDVSDTTEVYFVRNYCGIDDMKFVSAEVYQPESDRKFIEINFD